ncbi:MAG: DNA polymerase III subunit delta [Planctomycetes bacterium RBG_16_59_8]|nr:MAG: DNA polymerase III subunit delta [Planctomycetes bacterium RBG_16_59_8]
MEVSEQALAVDLSTIPLFGGMSIVILDTRMKKSKATEEKKKEEEDRSEEEEESKEEGIAVKTIPPGIVDVLRRYVKEPSPSTLLLVIARSAKECGLDGAKNVVAVKCDNPRPDQLPGLIDAAVATKGKEIAPAAVQELIRRCRSGDIGMIVSHIDRLAAYVGKRKTIAAQDVAQLVVRNVDFNTFDMLKEVSAGRTGDAIDMLRVMLDNGVQPLMILGGIASSYRRLLEAKFLFQSGVAHATIAGRLGINPEKIGGFASVVRRYSEEDLKSRHREVLKTDLLMKTTGEKGERLLENLVLRLCRPAM